MSWRFLYVLTGGLGFWLDEPNRVVTPGRLWHGVGVFRLVAVDPAVSLDEVQAKRIRYVLLEFVPARRCEVRRDAPVEIWVTGHGPAELHPPLLERVEAIAGCQFAVTTEGG